MAIMELLSIFFGVLTLIGVGYFILSLISGGDLNLFDGINLDFLGGDNNFGCMVIAAFLAVFGGVGMLGTLSGWNVVITLVVGALVGALVGRIVLGVFKFISTQQSSPIRPESMIGTTGRVTINSPADKTGEAIFENMTISKHPVRDIDGEALKQGDQVVVVELSGGIFYVRRKSV